VADLLVWQVFQGDQYSRGPCGPGYWFLMFKTSCHDVDVLFHKHSKQVAEIAVERTLDLTLNLWVSPDFLQAYQQRRQPDLQDTYASVFHLETEEQALALLAEVGC
jgi:hypothetical protein